jgi:hypothetical protein
MNRKLFATIIFLLQLAPAFSADSIYTFRFRNDVTITIDKPEKLNRRFTQIIVYALPNGNSTAQTMGKKLREGDDWHFDIQHIKAQTDFIRGKDGSTNYIVAYVENDLKSWPAWTTKYSGQRLTEKIIDTIENLVNIPSANIHLNSHSGGGAFIFDYIKQVGKIKSNIRRITFIDSDYRYDSTYSSSLVNYVQSNKANCINVFAYNDSIALLNGKTFVSPTGGTWYRTRLMIRHFDPYFSFKTVTAGDLTMYKGKKKGVINIFLLDNPERKILHTKQVELNGFIHSVFVGTKFENNGYSYPGERAYEKFVQDKL